MFSASLGLAAREVARGVGRLLPAKRIFTRSSGCSARLDKTPPLTPATRFSYRTWRNTTLHAADPAADWPWPVMGSGLVDTTASSAAEVGRDVVAATVATVVARDLEPQDARKRVKEKEQRLSCPAPPSRPGPAHSCARKPSDARRETAEGPPPPAPGQSDYGTPRGPDEPSGCYTAEPRDRKKPAEGKSRVRGGRAESIPA